jgi:hypothetical protein
MRIVLWSLLVVVSFSPYLLAAAEKTLPEEFTYKVNNNQVTITGYNGKNKDLVIPPVIEGYPVTAIAPAAFQGKSNGFDSYHLVDSIVLPEGLLSIGADAFSANPIEELKLPDSLIYIGDKAFSATRIRELKLPDSLIYIGDMAFAFTLIQELIIPENITHIGKEAFAFTRIRELTIPGSITYIGDMAFAFTPSWASDEKTAWVRKRFPPALLLQRRIRAGW